jgi:hypothetical protein
MPSRGYTEASSQAVLARGGKSHAWRARLGLLCRYRVGTVSQSLHCGTQVQDGCGAGVPIGLKL